MNLLDHVSLFQPAIKRRQCETLYCWGDLLAVVVMDDGEVGQFACQLACTRPEVEEVVALTSTVEIDG